MKILRLFRMQAEIFEYARRRTSNGAAIDFTPELRSQLAEVDPYDRQGRTYGQIIVAKAIQMAKKGHIRAINEIADRLEGKPAQNVNLDARVTTHEERVANILENLKALKASQANDEPSNPTGVLVIGDRNPRSRKRAYTTLRIPQFVLDRVHKRLSRV